MYEETKDEFRANDLFTETDRLEISEETFRRVVKEFERFDLSKIGDDIKGLAFERFLGTTFRGELGQFFTPRPVVDFMVNLLDPQEGETICDPAAGSGGFLIRAFEHVRGRSAADIQAEKDRVRTEIEAEGLDSAQEEARIDEAFAALNRELLPSNDDGRPVGTRVGRLAWRCIFGCDAEPRPARTAKMNMIMHGDGHGGIHHDGLVDINGIFPDRFDVVVTNPPFGAKVGRDQKIGETDQTRVPGNDAYLEQCRERYGEAWEHSHRRMRAAAGTNILDLFEVGRGKANRATEIVFVERCLSLLRPGGRMGIVLPDGNLNNLSLDWLRRWCEGKARILAIVSLPEETFRSADATVKASLVFLRRFPESDKAEWEAAWQAARARHDGDFDAQRDELSRQAGPQAIAGEDPAAQALLDELAGLGVERTGPGWAAGLSARHRPDRVAPAALDRQAGRPGGRKPGRPVEAGFQRRFRRSRRGGVQSRARRIAGRVETTRRGAQRRPLGNGARGVRLPGLRCRAALGRHHFYRRDGRQRAERPAGGAGCLARLPVLDGRRCKPGGPAGFSPALRCLIRRWRALRTWIEGPEFQTRRYAFDTAPLGDVLVRRVSPIDKEVSPLQHLNIIAKVTFGGELFLRGEVEKRG